MPYVFVYLYYALNGYKRADAYAACALLNSCGKDNIFIQYLLLYHQDTCGNNCRIKEIPKRKLSQYHNIKDPPQLKNENPYGDSVNQSIINDHVNKKNAPLPLTPLRI